MKTNTWTLLSAMAVLALAAGCRKHNDAVKEITVEDLVAFKDKAQVTVYDANGKEFREKNGVIPGALLLASYKDYDAAKTLPADKAGKVVFYCSNKL